MLFPNVKASTLKKIVAISSSNGSLTEAAGGRRRNLLPEQQGGAQPGDAARRRIGERRRRHRGDVQPRADAQAQMYLKGQFKGMLETSFTVGNMIKTIDTVTIADEAGDFSVTMEFQRHGDAHTPCGTRDGRYDCDGRRSSGRGAIRPAGSRPTLEQDLAAITEFNRRYLKAINDEDIATLSSLTTEDHIMISSGRAPLVGKAAQRRGQRPRVQAIRHRRTWTPVETVVDGDLAYQRGTFTVEATPRAGGNTTKSSETSCASIGVSRTANGG